MTVGSVSLYWYSLLMSASLFIGYILLYWQFKRTGYTETWADSLMSIRLFIYLIVGFIAGALIGDRLFYPAGSFSLNPFAVTDFKSGLRGLSSHGAAMGIITVSFLFHLRNRLGFADILDRTAFSVAVGATLVRVGNLMNSEIVGKKTNVPWAFCFPKYDGALIPRHPSQIYEVCIGLAVLLLLLRVDKKAGGEKRPPGLVSGTFLCAYFSLRFVVELFKEYQVLSQESLLTMGQVLSIPFIVAGACLITWSLKKRSL